MTSFPLATTPLAALTLLCSSVCAADHPTGEATRTPVEIEPQVIFGEPCTSLFERPAACARPLSSGSSARMSPTWTAHERDLLRHERSEVRIVGPSFGVAFSVLGIVAGAWLLAIGVEARQGPVEDCGHVGSWCLSRPAPYAGTVLMGLSSVGLGRTAKRLRRRAQQRRRLSHKISELASR